MKNSIFKIALIIVSIAVLLYGYHLYNKQPIDVISAKSDIVLSSEKLISDYQKDENSANKKYVNKIIEVSGKIANIDFENGNGIITLKSENNSSILCTLSPKENLKALKIKKDSIITVKGLCTGYLLDVMMDKCVIVN